MRKDIKFSNLARRRKRERFREHAYFDPTGCWGVRARALDGAPRARSLRSVRCSSRCTVGAGAVMLTPDPGARSRTSPVSHLILFALATVNTKEFGPPNRNGTGVGRPTLPVSHVPLPNSNRRWLPAQPRDLVSLLSRVRSILLGIYQELTEDATELGTNGTNQDYRIIRYEDRIL